MSRVIEIMDTTLRDGQQMPGSCYTTQEKFEIAKFLLDRVGVDRIEVASALTSEGERRSLQTIMEWAEENGFSEKVEALGFVDNNKSVEWISSTGCRVLNLLCKGSEAHCTIQLRQTVWEHIENIRNTVNIAVCRGMRVNVYLEDWSRGVAGDWHGYVQPLVRALSAMKIDRIMLPDTLGVLYPAKVAGLIKRTKRSCFGKKLDFHAHNDYGLGTANTLAAVSSGAVNGVHVTVNGVGERTGNASLEQVACGIHDFTRYRTAVNETMLRPVSRMVSQFSGRHIPANAPITGRDVFSDGCGVHSDGNAKGGIYWSMLTSERFGAKFVTALSSQSGKASLKKCLRDDLGITSLDDEQIKQLRQRIVHLNDVGKRITLGDLLVLVSEICNEPLRIIVVLDENTVESVSRMNKMSRTRATIMYHKESYEIEGEGNGGFDAFMNALRPWAEKMRLRVPELVSYQINTPPGGKSDALTEADITWTWPGGLGEFQTIGVSSDQVMAAIRSAVQALNVCNHNGCIPK